MAFEVIHLIHSPGWNWRRTAKGCVEAFAFFVLSIPIIVGVSYSASRIADRFSFDPLEESAICRYLALAILIPLLLCWNGRRWNASARLKRLTIDLVHDLAILERMEVNIHVAKTNFSRLLQRVAMGEEVIIAKAGKPVAKLVPISSGSKRRMLGSAKGEFVVPDDFNEPLPKEIEDLFYGE